ncbi:tRNA-modifying protein YgfZ [Anaplasma platys]|uniref:tRNA-modifying protein YgfZ n=1 Tax=Anaplasma platys TaxID=949 RepID=A0A858PZG9_9RICK|nr:folate-binding protein YgfZ [Anaplasma platys]QJC27954.1 tRNA-modifying protein YgfZ [Anaplasma platys]
MFKLSTRCVIKVSGCDAAPFLHNITTNDVNSMVPPTAIYNCILNSRGRFLYEFFLVKLDEYFLIDCACTEREDLIAFLRLYRVQLKVKVLKADQYVVAVDVGQNTNVNAPVSAEIGENGTVSFADPRCAELGMRHIIPINSPALDKISREQDSRVYDEIRIRNTIPSPEDMVKGESFPLHFGLDRVNAICHRKGCYIGQETVARMHIIGAKKKLYTLWAVASPDWPPFSTEVYAGEMLVGKLLTTAGPYGLSLLDVSKVQDHPGSLRVGNLPVTVTGTVVD